MGRTPTRTILRGLEVTLFMGIVFVSTSCEPFGDAMCDLFSDDPECEVTWFWEHSPYGYDYDTGSDADVETQDCGAVSYEGCCDGDTLYYCDSGYLTSINCQSATEYHGTCGWYAEDGEAFYDCVDESVASAEPSGAHPMECPEG